MFRAALIAALLLAGTAQGQPQTDRRLGPPPGQSPAPPPSASRLPTRPPATAPDTAPERIPIDLGPDAPTGEPPEQINILSTPTTTETASAAVIKECEDQREAGVVAGEIVVCRALETDTSQLYSGSREAWLKDYAERTQNAGTIAPPDVAGPGIFRGPATISGLCFIPPCPEPPALIIDVEAIPPPPAGSDAERVAQGLPPLKDDDAPLSDEERQRVAAELGLPEPPQPEPGGR